MVKIWKERKIDFHPPHHLKQINVNIFSFFFSLNSINWAFSLVYTRKKKSHFRQRISSWFLESQSIWKQSRVSSWVMFRRPLYLSRHNSEPTKSIMSIRIHTFLLTEKEASTSKRSTVQGLTAGRKERAGRWSSPPPSYSGRRRGGGRPRRRAGTRHPSPARPQHLPAATRSGACG